MIKVLVTGSDGQLGRELRRLASGSEAAGFSWLFTEAEDMDIANREAVAAVFGRENPDAVVNCAAFTDVDGAESSPEAAFRVNCDGVAILAEAAARSGASLVHISTDFVFDGCSGVPYSEDDSPAPLNVYGRSKLEGERAVAASGCKGVVVRTSWLYSPYGHNFVKSILAASYKGTPLRVVGDQWGSPTAADGLAAAIVRMIPEVIAGGRQGEIYHYCDSGVVSRAGFAGEILDMAGERCAVEPVSSDSYPMAAVRPAYSALDTSKIGRDFGIFPAPWRYALARNIERIME